MKESSSSPDRLMAVLVLIATAVTIIFNGLAATGYVNGVNPAEISAKYPTVLTPAGWAFSIWSLIYLGLIAFSIFQLLPANGQRFRKVRVAYLLSCVFNCGWIYFWHHDQIAVCLALITALLASLIVILWHLRPKGTKGEAVFAKAPFGIYAGWVTAAALVNVSVLLKATGSEMTPQSSKLLGIACLLIAAAAAVAVRFKLRNYLYPLAVAWAATAIAINQSGNTALIVAAALCVIVCLVMAVSFVMDQKSSAV